MSHPRLASLARFAGRTLHRARTLSVAIAAVALLAGPVLAQPKAAPKKGDREIEEKTLTTVDGVSIAATYFKSAKGKESPVVVLLHQENGSQLVWRSFAERLQDDGYAVVTVDLRHHGKSATETATTTSSGKGKSPSFRANDYKAMVVGDLEAVKSFLVEEHEKQNLNVRKLAVVAAGMSAPIAAAFAERDWLRTPHDDAPTLDARTPRGQDVRALILLSPDEDVPGVQAGAPLVFLRAPNLNVAMFIGYGGKDKTDKSSTKLYKKLTEKGKADRFLLQKYDYAFHGTDMLGQNIKLEAHLLGFLKKYLMDLNGPNDEWRTRKSRLAS